MDSLKLLQHPYLILLPLMILLRLVHFLLRLTNTATAIVNDSATRDSNSFVTFLSAPRATNSQCDPATLFSFDAFTATASHSHQLLFPFYLLSQQSRKKKNFWLAGSGSMQFFFPCSRQLVLDRSDRVFIIWSKRIRTFACRYQKPMPYHLAILHTALFWTVERGEGEGRKEGKSNRTGFSDIAMKSNPPKPISLAGKEKRPASSTLKPFLFYILFLFQMGYVRLRSSSSFSSFFFLFLFT